MTGEDEVVEQIARVFDVPLNIVEGSGQYANAEDEARARREWLAEREAAVTEMVLHGSVYYSASTGRVIRRDGTK